MRTLHHRSLIWAALCTFAVNADSSRGHILSFHGENLKVERNFLSDKASRQLYKEIILDGVPNDDEDFDMNDDDDFDMNDDDDDDDDDDRDRRTCDDCD